MNNKNKALFVIFLIYMLALVLAAMTVIYLPHKSPLVRVFVADIFATIVVFIFSFIYKNSSVYDPYWSVAPVFIIIYWFINSGNFLELDYLKLIMFFVIIVWGIRLTVNWMLRWNGFSDEDWRYVDIKNKTGKLYWPVSFLGLHMMPTLWVFLGMMPVYYGIYNSREIEPFISIFALGFTVFAIWLEATADNQLRTYLITRTNKNERLRTGLWGIMPYPNYIGEMLFWWGLYLFSVGFNTENWWTIFGPLSITFLFIFVSIPLMKKRLANKKG